MEGMVEISPYCRGIRKRETPGNDGLRMAAEIWRSLGHRYGKRGQGNYYLWDRN